MSRRAEAFGWSILFQDTKKVWDREMEMKRKEL